MTSADLIAWQSQMGFTQAQAAAALGVGLATYRDWITGVSRTTGKATTIERRTGLACAALASGLEEYPTNGHPNNSI